MFSIRKYIKFDSNDFYDEYDRHVSDLSSRFYNNTKLFSINYFENILVSILFFFFEMIFSKIDIYVYVSKKFNANHLIL